MPIEGPSDDGTPAAGFPVQVGGTDAQGNIRTLATTLSGSALTMDDRIRQLLEEILIELRLARGIEEI